MFFRDIIGQNNVKTHLISQIKAGKMPHALLICGKNGTGKLPLALACARYLCCQNPQEDDACGTCPSCIKMNKLVHPDVHFIYPVIKKKAGKDTLCADFLPEWREQLLESPYFSLEQWLKRMGAGNQQAQIFVKESEEISAKLSLKSSQGGYKTVIIWLPEKMNQECSNKLLKLLEEPPSRTVFLLVSEEPDNLLPTIQSRTQRITLPPIEESEIAKVLTEKYLLVPTDAYDIARRAEGSFIQAIDNIRLGEEEKLFFDLFVSLMRLSYQRRIKDMKLWSEQVAELGRERQKSFLNYCQYMIRENFILNFHSPQMNYMNEQERKFSSRFAPYVNERNIINIAKELEEAQIHVEQNVNPKMIFFDLSLKMIVQLKSN